MLTTEKVKELMSFVTAEGVCGHNNIKNGGAIYNSARKNVCVEILKKITSLEAPEPPTKLWAATGYLQAVNNLVNYPEGIVTAPALLNLLKQADMPIDALIEAQESIEGKNQFVTEALLSLKPKKK